MSNAILQLESGMPPVIAPTKKGGRYNLILMTNDNPGIFVFEMSEEQAKSLATSLSTVLLKANHEWLKKLEEKQ